MDHEPSQENDGCNGKDDLNCGLVDREPAETLPELATGADSEMEALDRENVLELEAFIERKQWIQEQIKVMLQ
jgi:hypothetical protein